MKSDGVLTAKRSAAAAVVAGVFVLVALVVTTAIYFYAVAAGAYIDPDSGEHGDGIHYIRYEGGSTAGQTPADEEAQMCIRDRMNREQSGKRGETRRFRPFFAPGKGVRSCKNAKL